MFEIQYAEGVEDDLEKLSANKRNELLDKIDEQLMHQPGMETRNRKMLEGVKAPWKHEEPLWELRVGNYRIFYDINDTAKRVTVRVVRHKPPHKTTKEIL